MIERALISSDEILDAARHRLRNWSLEQIEAGIAALASQNAPYTVSNIMAMLKDKRDLSSATSALLVLLANAQGDAVLFWRSGCGVIDSYRQAQRALARDAHDGDALDRLILNYLDEIPDISPKELWDDFKERAENDHDVLVDNESAEIILYAPYRDAAGIPIKFGAFRKRVQKIRRKVRTQRLRSHPMLYADHRWMTSRSKHAGN